MTQQMVRRDGGEVGTRWGDPFAEFHRLNQEFNRLAQNVFGQWPTWPTVAWQGFHTPPADIVELEDHYLVEVELPGFRKEDVSVEVQGRRVVIEAERGPRERPGNFRTETRTTGRFHYEAVLPSEIDESKISADLRDGVLAVRLPKTETARKRKVEIRSS